MLIVVKRAILRGPGPKHDGAWTEAVPSRDSPQNCQGALKLQRQQECRRYGR